MVNAFKVLRAIDEAITNKLEKFCWWTDIHYDKDNVWWAKVTLVFIFPFLNAIQICLSETDVDFSNIFFIFFAGFFVAWAIFYLCTSYFSVTQKILTSAQKSPNKNRTDIDINMVKVIAIVEAFIFWSTRVSSLFGITHGFDLATLISFELILYFLCTEPIPPATKSKKLKEKEIKRLQYLPQKN